MIGNPWTGPVPRSVDAIAVAVDVCVREDYDEAQRVARLRARFRGVRQRVEFGHYRIGKVWRIGDDTFLTRRSR